MTDDQSKDAASPPEATGNSNFAKAAQAKSSPKNTGAQKTTGRRGKGWLWLLLFAALAGGLGAWGWYHWPQLAAHLEALRGSLTDDQVTIVEEQAAPDAPREAPPPPPPGQRQDLPPAPPHAIEAQQQANAALRNRIHQQDRAIAQLQQQLATLQRSVTAQGNRLGELGNVSRSDWQLAEADYLLRLANQRLLLERDSRAALGLLEEVDKILRQVNLPDLYGVRQQLAADVTALKLVENIDLEGLYTRLRALEDQLVRANIQPEFDLAPLEPTEAKAEGDSAQSSPWRHSWDNFTRFMHNSVRIRDGDIDPVLLSPQSEARFRQSLRLNMEQAELALLRGDSTVYKDALNRARQLLLEYGTASNQRDVLARELQQLSEEKIEVELPNLAASQRALHNYIEQLHKTAAAPGGDIQ